MKVPAVPSTISCTSLEITQEEATWTLCSEYMNQSSATLSWKKLSCQPVSLFKKRVSRTVLTMSHKGWFNIN